jgi:alpha-L-rhamnosidase
LSQYDIRALYHTYDVQSYLQVGTNVVAVYVGLGWFGHPPLSKAYGPPTLRALLRISTYSTNTNTNTSTNTNGISRTNSTRGAAAVVVQTLSVGTDTSWVEAVGPVIYNDIYNGTTYDARLETPGWTTPDFKPSSSGPVVGWTAVLAGAMQPDFKLNSTILSAASFPAVEVIQSIPAISMRMPAPGVYVYDFGQNMPGT